MKYTIVIAVTLLSSSAFSWEGYNNDTDSYIDVETYDHRGIGEGEVSYYDYDTGEYKDGYLDMYPGGSGELTDSDTGETYSVDMD